MIESFMKTSRVEGPYPLAFETFADVAKQLPPLFDKYNAKRPHSALDYLSPNQFEEQSTRPPSKQPPDGVRRKRPTPRNQDDKSSYGQPIWEIRVHFCRLPLSLALPPAARPASVARGV
jgi:hypothetical protein